MAWKKFATRKSKSYERILKSVEKQYPNKSAEQQIYIANSIYFKRCGK